MLSTTSRLSHVSQTVMGQHLTPTRTAMVKKNFTIASADEVVEKSVRSSSEDGDVKVKWRNYFGKAWQLLRWLSTELPHELIVPPLGHSQEK